MDHVVIPLDRDHRRTVASLAAEVAAAAGTAVPSGGTGPHVTVVAHAGLSPAMAHRAVADALAGFEPFVVHAHGIGIFTGDGPRDLSVHVPLVRTHQLDELHRRVCEGLAAAGGEVAGWTDAERWTPHITLADRGLDAEGLGACVAFLARRRHPSWHILVERVLVTGDWAHREEPGLEVVLGHGARLGG